MEGDTATASQEAIVLETIYYRVPPQDSSLSSSFRGLSPYEPPVPSNLWLIAEPVLISLGLYTPPDPTYSRYLIPALPEENTFLESPYVVTTRRRIFTDATGGAENVKVVQAELDRAKGRDWIYYQTWEAPERRGKIGDGIDIVCVHGIGEYGARWCVHVAKFIQNGFRIIAPDLPAHGRSTGIHCYVPTNDLLVSSVKLVLEDVDEQDQARQRVSFTKRFIAGASLGAFVILEYLLAYPPADAVFTSISGAFLMCPLIQVAAASRPSYLLELIARALRTFAGRVPFASAQRGKGHWDPRAEISFLLNPQPYHGPLRIGTGLAIAQGIDDLAPRAKEIRLPIKVIHGSADRITSPEGSKDFFERVSSQDLEFEIWPGYEHVMMKVGYDREDDQPRQKTLESWYAWIAERV
ncbi:Lysophospholipase [Phaffia rhodozyma]|uniref:Lysophospholipase n=1 Tax=Phaffia rhodozyma TaxID=264483 RepID=A0A0F7SEA0_PHARH|nr:Lysophospholipase [Phaffia rhodozyma]